MNRTTPPAAPAFKDLPPRRSPSTGARSDFSVSLAIVTPILGGGYRTRALDDIDIIRVPTVRGHLRFWWRALFAGDSENSTALYTAETKLWGGPGGPDKAPAVRSPVEVRIEVTDDGSEERGDIDPQKTAGAYALFPARSERRGGQETKKPIPRRTGVRFNLTVTAPADEIAAVRDAVRAWILFGGYGGRTRRGLGGLSVIGPDAATWLPHPDKPLDAEMTRLFGRDVFAAGGLPRQVPRLAGAALSTIGLTKLQCLDAWIVTIEALRSFRQGTNPQSRATRDGAGILPSQWARQPGFAPEPGRPSISNWPEADKVRHLAPSRSSTRAYTHVPRHNNRPAWPRAGFGLPIVGRFQTKRRRGDSGQDYHEPPDFMLKWRQPSGPPRERLASPLIIKALPLVGGRFVAIALWLHRAWPAGEIVLEISGNVVPGSAAPFDALLADGDTPLFTALADKPTLRSAFLDWLALRPDVTTVFPRRGAGGGAR